MKSYAIILGGGSGRRMEADRNKVFLPLRGIPAIVRAIAPFSALCAGAVVVAAAAEVEEMRAVIARCGLDRFVMRVVSGGAERQDSVRCGLDALPADAECVLIHDGARALVTEDVIRRAIESVEKRGSGIASVPVTDTIKRAAPDGLVLDTPDRSRLWAVQTPQIFDRERYLRAAEEAERRGLSCTDDCQLFEAMGWEVQLVMGDYRNLKLTTPEDFLAAGAYLEGIK